MDVGNVRASAGCGRAFQSGLLSKSPVGPREAVEAAGAHTAALGKPDAAPSEVAVSWAESERADRIRLPLYETGRKTSVVTGQPLLTYVRGKVHEIEVPWYHRSQATARLPRPRGYLVLPGWPPIEAVLRGQGLKVERLLNPVEMEVETMRLSSPEYAKAPYQGLTQVQAKVARQKERRQVPAGALWVPADQPDFELAVELLEPESPDSLLAWGLLSTLFEQKEYIAPQVLEGIVDEKLKDPKVAAEWQEALKDEAFAKDPAARSRWWYRRTPYFDERVGLLPVFRVMQTPKLTTRPWR